MTDIRQANRTAREAFRKMLAHHFRTGEWSPELVADWHEAEDLFDQPEWLLDANHDAILAEMEELEDEEVQRLPDIPLAAYVSESELRALFGDR